MSEHPPLPVERHCDVAVIGGSVAGLAAALQLGRQRRSVIVVDAGEPRNAPASHMHSYLGHEGVPPEKLAALAREEVRSYGGEILSSRATGITRDGDRFRTELASGHTVVSRRVIAATGVVDELPTIDGLAQHWGSDAVHCPFCHGYEARDQRIVQVLTHPAGLHQSTLWRQLTDDLTIVLHDGVAADHPELDRLRGAGVTVIDERVARIITGRNGRVVAVELADDTNVLADALAVVPRFKARIDAFRSTGLTTNEHRSGLGDCIDVDHTGATSVPGLHATGNLTDPSLQALPAAADGSRVGGMVAFSLADDDLDTAEPPSANATDWDRRYRDDQLWSGNPNGALVAEVTGLQPGRALDVGAGEGADAIWLVEQGWAVTAADISQRALDRATAEAHRRGIQLDTLRTDVNQQDAFDAGAYDLVSAHYASIPRTPDARGVHTLLDAVAPGGTLLVVNHDLDSMHTHSRPFDPDAYVRGEDFTAAIGSSPSWEIEVHETRRRPPGHVHTSPHVDDVVLRARRLTTPAPT